VLSGAPARVVSVDKSGMVSGMMLTTLLLTASLVAQGAPALQGQLGSERFLEVHSIDALARDAESGRVLSCASGGSFSLWDEAYGVRLGQLELGIDRAVAIGFLGPDLFLIGSVKDHLRLVSWDAERGVLEPEDLFEFGWGDLVDLGGAFRLSPDRKRLAQWRVAAGGKGVLLAELDADAKEAGARRLLEVAEFRVDAAAWSSDGALLAVMATNGPKVIGRAGTRVQDSSRVYVFDATSAEEVQRLVSHDDLLQGVEFGPSAGAEERLVVAGGAAGFHLWELAEGRELAHFAVELDVQELRVAAGGSEVLAVSRTGALEAWRLSLDAEPERFFERDLGRILGPIWFEGEFLLAGQGRRIRRWRLADWSLAPDVIGHTSALAALDVRAGRVLSVGLDGSVIVWSEEQGRVVATDHDGLVFDASLAPDAKRLLTCGQDATLRIWSLADETFGAQLKSWSGRAAAGFTGAAFSPRGDVLAGVTADGVLWIRSAADGELLRTFEGLQGLKFQLTFSDDGGRLAVGSTGVRVWDTTTWELVADVKELVSPVTALDFGPGGQELAVGLARRVVEIVDLASGVVRATSAQLPSRVAAVAYFGERIAATSARLGGVRLLDRELRDAGLLVTPEGLDIGVLASDGLHLFAGDQHGRIQIWR
jgi:WD40 repeat protein